MSLDYICPICNRIRVATPRTPCKECARVRANRVVEEAVTFPINSWNIVPDSDSSSSSSSDYSGGGGDFGGGGASGDY